MNEFRYDICYNPRDYEVGGKYFGLEDEPFHIVDSVDELQLLYYHIKEFENGKWTMSASKLPEEELNEMLREGIVILDWEAEIVTDEFFKNYEMTHYLFRADILDCKMIAAASRSGWDLSRGDKKYERPVDSLSGVVCAQAGEGVKAIQFMKNNLIAYFYNDGSRKIVRGNDVARDLMCNILYYDVPDTSVVDNEVDVLDMFQNPDDYGVVDYVKASVGVDLSNYLSILPEDLNKATWGEEQTKFLRAYEKLGDVVVEMYSVTHYIPHFPAIGDFQDFSSDLVCNKNLAVMFVKSGLSAFFRSTSKSKMIYQDFADMFECIMGMIFEASGCVLEKSSECLRKWGFDVYCFARNDSMNHPLLNVLEVNDFSSSRVYCFRASIIMKSSEVTISLKFNLSPLYDSYVPVYNGTLFKTESGHLAKKKMKVVEGDYGKSARMLDSVTRYAKNAGGSNETRFADRTRNKLSSAQINSGDIVKVTQKFREFDQLNESAKVSKTYKFNEDNQVRCDIVELDCSDGIVPPSYLISTVDELSKAKTLGEVVYDFGPDERKIVTGTLWRCTAEVNFKDGTKMRVLALHANSKKNAKICAASRIYDECVKRGLCR